MIKGDIKKNKPWVKVVIGARLGVQEILLKVDTGFTGELKVSEKIAAGQPPTPLPPNPVA